MSNLRICQTVSLHPKALDSTTSSSSQSTRICLMGCQDAKPSELRRFPVHDEQRCKQWLKHFGIDNKLVEKIGGLPKLRICYRHFSQRQVMAKTRIKMTPLRKSKGIATNGVGGGGGGAAAAAADSSTTTIELVESSTDHLEPHQQQPTNQSKKSVTTITPVLPPQRSHSICSSASSDVQSINSDYETSLPLAALVDAQQNGQPKKRKLYLITEKSDQTKDQPQKRKMFVVVEQEKDAASAKKLMFISDKPEANLTQHLEKLLPEILNRIQDKDQPTQKPPTNNSKPKPTITLPPKKNPTNFIKPIPSTTPSPTLVSAPPLPQSVTIQPVLPAKETPTLDIETDFNPEEMETNINLSPDFRFLMKILPKLEQLPEPHKQNVKRSIQIFVEKSYSIYAKKE